MNPVPPGGQTCITDSTVPCALASYRAAVRVSELKAELELRSISIEGLFEKEELARKLAEARATGRADPSVIDEFNKQSAERAWDATQGNLDVGEAPDVSGATASDGSLPGGMDAATVQAMMQNPEMMAVLRNPKMQEVMAKVMQGGPEAAAEFMSDPEVREMLQKVKGLTG